MHIATGCGTYIYDNETPIAEILLENRHAMLIAPALAGAMDMQQVLYNLVRQRSDSDAVQRLIDEAQGIINRERIKVIYEDHFCP
jgi:hypothetical protein